MQRRIIQSHTSLPHTSLQYIERDGSARVDYIPEDTIQLPEDMATIDAGAPWGCARCWGGGGAGQEGGLLGGAPALSPPIVNHPPRASPTTPALLPARRRLDRIDQAALPLDGAYAPGQLDGRGVHIYVLDTGLRT